jgi:hypothetical protein
LLLVPPPAAAQDAKDGSQGQSARNHAAKAHEHDEDDDGLVGDELRWVV